MAYLSELHYFFDTKNFPLEKAVKVTAKAAGKWCNGYKARLIAPKKGIKEICKYGKLPLNYREKGKFIGNLVDWIFKSSEQFDLFELFLYKNFPPKKDKKYAKFDHHDDTCCWILDINEKEFSELKKVWKKNDLPTDLFYHESKGFCIPNKKGIVAKSFEKLGFTIESSTCYTPLRWKYRNSKTSKKFI